MGEKILKKNQKIMKLKESQVKLKKLQKKKSKVKFDFWKKSEEIVIYQQTKIRHEYAYYLRYKNQS